jgi:hypothetical protein
MTRLLIVIAALAFSAGATAQLYKWKDANGRMQYGDVPPPGVDATPMRAPPAGSPAPAPADKKADSKSDKALSPEAAFRKRQQERDAADDKDAKDRAQAENKRANCDQAQGQLRLLESGQRVATINTDGERVIMDDDARARQMERAQKAVSDWCN